MVALRQRQEAQAKARLQSQEALIREAQAQLEVQRLAVQSKLAAMSVGAHEEPSHRPSSTVRRDVNARLRPVAGHYRKQRRARQVSSSRRPVSAQPRKTIGRTQRDKDARVLASKTAAGGRQLRRPQSARPQLGSPAGRNMAKVAAQETRNAVAGQSSTGGQQTRQPPTEPVQRSRAQRPQSARPETRARARTHQRVPPGPRRFSNRPRSAKLPASRKIASTPTSVASRQVMHSYMMGRTTPNSAGHSKAATARNVLAAERKKRPFSARARPSHATAASSGRRRVSEPGVVGLPQARDDMVADEVDLDIRGEGEVDMYYFYTPDGRRVTVMEEPGKTLQETGVPPTRRASSHSQGGRPVSAQRGRSTAATRSVNQILHSGRRASAPLQFGTQNL